MTGEPIRPLFLLTLETFEGLRDSALGAFHPFDTCARGVWKQPDKVSAVLRLPGADVQPIRLKHGSSTT